MNDVARRFAAEAMMGAHEAPAPFNDRFARTLGSDLTPQLVAAALANAEIGYMWNQADLLDEVRERDGHLHSELQKREMRVAGAPWELKPPEGAGEEGARIASWLTAQLNAIEGNQDLARSFADALSDWMSAVYQGRAGHEVEWGVRDGFFVPRRLWWVHPRRFAYATDWRLHLWDAFGTSPTAFAPIHEAPGEYYGATMPENLNSLPPASVGPFGMYPGIAVDAFPAGKFVVHAPRVRGVYPTREGLGRLLVWWSCFKRFSVRDFAALTAWAGRGLRVGTYATGKGELGDTPATDDDVRVLLATLESMSSTTAGVIGDTTKIDISYPSSDNDVHDRLNALCNAEISKATLGGTLGSDVSRGGNRSLGEVQERNEIMIGRADAKSLAATIYQGLLVPMVRHNFGPRAPVPTIEFNVEPPENLEAKAKVMKLFVDMGGRLGERTTGNALGMPEKESDEPLIGGPSKAPAEAPQQPVEGDPRDSE